MKFLKHPITKSGVYKDEYDGEFKQNNKDNYGNEYKEEDIGVQDEDVDNVVMAQNDFLMGQTTEYYERSIFTLLSSGVYQMYFQ